MRGTEAPGVARTPVEIQAPAVALGEAVAGAVHFAAQAPRAALQAGAGEVARIAQATALEARIGDALAGEAARARLAARTADPPFAPMFAAGGFAVGATRAPPVPGQLRRGIGGAFALRAPQRRPLGMLVGQGIEDGLRLRPAGQTQQGLGPADEGTARARCARQCGVVGGECGARAVGLQQQAAVLDRVFGFVGVRGEQGFAHRQRLVEPALPAQYQRQAQAVACVRIGQAGIGQAGAQHALGFIEPVEIGQREDAAGMCGFERGVERQRRLILRQRRGRIGQPRMRVAQRRQHVGRQFVALRKQRLGGGDRFAMPAERHQYHDAVALRAAQGLGVRRRTGQQAVEQVQRLPQALPGFGHGRGAIRLAQRLHRGVVAGLPIGGRG
jgi:hypothetical protein